MTAFYLCAAEVISTMSCFVDGFKDHDLDDFRNACNLLYYDHSEWMCRTRLGIPIREFGPKLFEAIVWKSERDDGGFT